MILRATFVRRGRKSYTCFICNQPIIYHHIYVYGGALDLDPKPWPTRLHMDCAASWTDPKIDAAVAAGRAYENQPRKIMTAKQNGLYEYWG